MLIIALLYICAAWLVFFRFKLLPWNWPWRIATVLMGCFVLAVFLALLNTLTPSGRIVVVGRVVEVTPNVAGTVTSIPVEPNVLVKAGTMLFQIDPAPYETKVKQLHAAVAEARQKAEQLKAQVELAVADVKGLKSQSDYAEQRRADIERLAQTSATSQFTLQDAIAKVDQVTAQLQAAEAREINARLALDRKSTASIRPLLSSTLNWKMLNGNSNKPRSGQPAMAMSASWRLQSERGRFHFGRHCRSFLAVR